MVHIVFLRFDYAPENAQKISLTNFFFFVEYWPLDDFMMFVVRNGGDLLQIEWRVDKNH